MNMIAKRQVSRTGPARIARLGPAFCMRTPIGGLHLARPTTWANPVHVALRADYAETFGEKHGGRASAKPLANGLPASVENVRRTGLARAARLGPAF